MGITIPPIQSIPLADQMSSLRIETTPRISVFASQALTSGNAFFAHFTPSRTMVVGNILTAVRGTGAATVTTSKVGIYTVAANGNLACIARSANNLTLWTTTPSLATSPIADDGAASPGAISSVTLVRGQRYAVGLLFVGTTAPQVAAANPGVVALVNLAPLLASVATGQTDLAASYTFGGTVNATSVLVWAGLTA